MKNTDSRSITFPIKSEYTPTTEEEKSPTSSEETESKKTNSRSNNKSLAIAVKVSNKSCFRKEKEARSLELQDSREELWDSLLINYEN